MLSLERAEAVAYEIAGDLIGPACGRVLVAGSIRRKRPHVKDIEIVAQPNLRREKIPGQLFGMKNISLLDAQLEALFTAAQSAPKGPRKLAIGERNGDRWKQLVCSLPQGEITIDLFLVLTPCEWGSTAAIRTGPKEFIQLCMTPRWKGGAMPHGMQQRDRRLWKGQAALDTPTEQSWFEALGLPHWRAEDRTPEKLKAWLTRQHATSAH